MTVEIPTEYFVIAKGNPELEGPFTGEILNNAGSPDLHLRLPDGSNMQSKQGNGDIVITGISRVGWNALINVMADLTPEANIVDAKRALTQSPFLTWDRPTTQH